MNFALAGVSSSISCPLTLIALARAFPFQTTQTKMKLTRNKMINLKDDLEALAKEDGLQRGVFFDPDGKAWAEPVSEQAPYPWLYKTKAGQPVKWGINE